MNGSFYQNPTYPNSEHLGDKLINTANRCDTNFFNLNKGKKIKVFVTFPFSSDRDKTFEGTIESVNNEILIIKTETEEANIIPLCYINYMVSNDPLIYV